MIVSCPSCGARYRIPDSAPETGPAPNLRCARCKTIFAPREEPAPLLSSPGSPEPADQGQPGGPQRILVADDANYFRQLVGDILREAGYEVHLAADGDEALNKVVETSPALLILDLQLPGKSGFDVLKALRRGHYAGLPVLVMSSVYTGTDHIMALGDIGANDFINKNFTPDHLLSRVRKLLKVSR